MNNTRLFTLLLTIFIDLLGFSILIPILPILSKEMGASNTMIGVIAGSYALMNFLFGPIWGNLSDRIGRKPVLLISILITASSYLLFSFSKTLSMLLLSRLIGGIGSANIGTAQAYISDITPPEDRSKSYGYVGAAFGLGFILGPLIGSWILQHYGMKELGFVVLTLNIVNFVLVLLIVTESLKVKNKTKAIFDNPLKMVVKGLRTPNLGKLMLISMLFIAAFSMMQVTISLFWNEKYALDKVSISHMFAFIGISSVLVQGFLVGRITKRFGEYKMLIIGSLLMMVGLYMIPMAPLGIGFYIVTGISIVLITLANGCLTPAINSLVSQLAPANQQGKYLGVSNSVSSIGRVIGPYLGGFSFGMAKFMPYYLGALIMFITWRLAKRYMDKFGPAAE